MFSYIKNLIICMLICLPKHGIPQEIFCNTIRLVTQKTDAFPYTGFGESLVKGLNRDQFLGEDISEGKSKVEFSVLIYKYYTNKPTRLERNDGCYAYLVSEGYKNSYDNHLIRESWDKFEIGMTFGYGSRVIVVRKGFDLHQRDSLEAIRIGLQSNISPDYSDKLLAAFNEQFPAELIIDDKLNYQSLAQGDVDVLVYPFGVLAAYQNISSNPQYFFEVEELAYLGEKRISSNPSLPTLTELGINYSEKIPISIAFPFGTDEINKKFIVGNIEKNIYNTKSLYAEILESYGFMLSID